MITKLIDSDIVHKVQADTYQREIERYGEETIELGEQIFFHDSEAVIDFIGLLETDDDERYRWLFALRGIDTMLS